MEHLVIATITMSDGPYSDCSVVVKLPYGGTDHKNHFRMRNDAVRWVQDCYPTADIHSVQGE